MVKFFGYITRPHKVNHARQGIPEVADYVAPSYHKSFEVSTKKEKLKIDKLFKKCQWALDKGGYLNLLNYPDIFQKELLWFIDNLDFSATWYTTHNDVCEWIKIAKYECELTMKGKDRYLVFHKPLPEIVYISVKPAYPLFFYENLGDTNQIIYEKGTSEVLLPWL